MTPGKRAFDVAFSLAGLVLLAPLLLAIAALVKWEDSGPVLYRQWRIGRRGRRFWLRKFRTMRSQPGGSGLEITVGDDPRITSVGAVLRRYKLDELPQLLNVLAGHMSLVGPRPEMWRYVRDYTPEQQRVLELVPGLTDPGSLAFRGEAQQLARSTEPERTYVEDVLPVKIRLSLEYAARATRWSDFVMVLRTILLVARPAPRERAVPHIFASRRMP